MKSFSPPSKSAPSRASVTPQRGSQSTKTIVNNRPSAVMQLKLQEMANSKGVLQARSANGGLPEDLKAGIESLSGYSLDDVKVHYNSSKPAEVGALAYAQGNDIYLAPGQEKHLAHEAWHVVQQKQGRVRPTVELDGGTAVNDNVGLEMEADRMGQRSSNVIQSIKSIVDNRPMAAKQHKLQETLNSSVQFKSIHPIQKPLQRKILYKGNVYPGTWKAIKDEDMLKAAKDFREQYDPNLDNEVVERVWNKVAKETKNGDFDVESSLKEHFDGRINKSVTAAENRKKRGDNFSQILAGLLENNADLEKDSKVGREGGVVDKKSKPVDYDKDMPAEKKMSRFIATLVRYLFGHNGQEAQVSMPKEKDGNIILSTNTNSSNRNLEEIFENAEDIKNLTVYILKKLEVGDKSLKEAMDNRTLRHLTKLYNRLEEYLKKNNQSLDTQITVPETDSFDGKHAEIRIVEDEEWTQETHHNPAGTMYPCFGCMLYFKSGAHPHGIVIDLGRIHGPMWLSLAAITSQVQKAIGKSKANKDLTDEDIAKLSKQIKDQCEKMAEDTEVKMGSGIHKPHEGHNHALCANYDADSISEISDDDYQSMLDFIKESELEEESEKKFDKAYDAMLASSKKEASKKRPHSENNENTTTSHKKSKTTPLEKKTQKKQTVGKTKSNLKNRVAAPKTKKAIVHSVSKRENKEDEDDVKAPAPKKSKLLTHD